MRIVFMGTPEFAVASLEAICQSENEVVLVVTQPDKPKGRGYNLTPSPVKQYALDMGIEVITPTGLKDPLVKQRLEAANADLFIVTAYGRILPKDILDIPKLGCFNVHASLLPKWRGAAPINRAVMNGDKVGGVTVMFMNEGLDTGDMVITREIDIPDTWTAEEYHDALAECSKSALAEFLDIARSGNIPAIKQEDAFATYAAKISNEDAFINFDRPARDVVNQIRGLSPFPGSFCFINQKRFKIRYAVLGDGRGTPGEIISTDKGGIEIACNNGSVIITRLCPEGKGVCDAESYLHGNKIEIGTIVNDGQGKA